MAATIEIYLVRHAIAAEQGPAFPDDRLRPLTPVGEQQFRQAVRGLSTMKMAVDVVLTSPLERARATALLLADGLKPKPAIEELEALAPGGRHAAIMDALATHATRHRRMALVGHEPDLGELAARLLGARGAIIFKKGAVCAIDLDAATPGGPGALRWHLPPRALRRLVP